jgi:hypothetical protein
MAEGYSFPPVNAAAAVAAQQPPPQTISQSNSKDFDASAVGDG